jgi:peptidoglycan/xylan/chitin deacetylase (PgdA/CDA1 family)
MIFILLILLSLFLSYQGIIPFHVVVLLFALCYWLPKPVVIQSLNYFYPSVLTHVESNDIALTFDDAPYGSESEILDLLNRWNQKATFFIISDNITPLNRPTLVKMVKDGHQLGNHGKTNSMHALKSSNRLRHEIEICDQAIRSIYVEAKVDLPERMVYRPGCGLFTSSMIELVESMNYRLALGSVYPNDPIVRIGVINYYYLLGHLERKDIIILHDRTWTIPLLKRLLPKLEDLNIKSVTLSNSQ